MSLEMGQQDPDPQEPAGWARYSWSSPHSPDCCSFQRCPNETRVMSEVTQLVGAALPKARSGSWYFRALLFHSPRWEQLRLCQDSRSSGQEWPGWSPALQPEASFTTTCQMPFYQPAAAWRWWQMCV